MLRIMGATVPAGGLLLLGAAVFGGWGSRAGMQTQDSGSSVRLPASVARGTCDPRVAIGPSSTPGDSDSLFKITAGGSYYLRGNLLGVAGKYGIEVASSDPVTIDLNGFQVKGVPGSLDGVSSIGAVSIHDGALQQWGGRGIAVGRGTLRDLCVESNGGDGIRSLSSTLVLDCTSAGNGADGISLADVSRIEGCITSGNQGRGIRLDGACIVSDCVVYNNKGGGILGGLAMIRDNELFSNQGASIESTGSSRIEGNHISFAATGILATGQADRIQDNALLSLTVALDIDGTGNLVARNTLGGNATGIDAVPGNSLGPTISVVGVGNIASTPGADHPLANLEH